MISLSNLVSLIKKAAVDAVEEGKPVALMFGEVKSVSPLEVFVEQKIVLKEKQLILMKSFKENVMENTLKVKDILLLLRMQGGQQFVVLGVM